MNTADIVTPFGVIWKIASSSEVFLWVLLVVLVIILLSLIKYLQYLQTKEINDHQLYLFKMKRLGLSNFQIKIMNNMVKMLHLTNPTDILLTIPYFESAMSRFLVYLHGRKESDDTLASIIKDVSIIYEKLYHSAQFRKPLGNIEAVESEQLLFFRSQMGLPFLGRITNRSEGELSVELFRDQLKGIELPEDSSVDGFLWRSGDAEYTFKARVIDHSGDYITIESPKEFFRGNESRHPFVDAIVPAILTKTELGTLEEKIEIKITIYKLNDFEAIIRVDHELDYQSKYDISFKLLDFQFNITSKIIAAKTIEEGSIFYYTLKFMKMSDAAQKILKKYIYEHL